MRYFSLPAVLFFWFPALACLPPCPGGEKVSGWPTYRHDIARAGASGETVRPPLALNWVFLPGERPRPAWPMPAEEPPRMHEDNAFHVVSAGGLAFFGSSVDDSVYAVEAASGKIRWRFRTEGPVRFAPTWSEGRVYFASDDGFVYCLDAPSGRLLWKYRPGPRADKVLGNGRMISLWPVRTSVLVDRGQVLFAAGVFPYEGLYFCALDPRSGRVLWRNDTIGDRAHELNYGGISPSGYLVASRDTLFVPSGRAMPAAFDRKTGRFRYYASPKGKRGGTWALLDKDTLITGVANQGTLEKEAYDAETGRYEGPAFAWFQGRDMVLTASTSYILTTKGVYALNRKAYARAVADSAAARKKRSSLRGRLIGLRRSLGKLRGKARKKRQALVKKVSAEIRSLDRRIAKAMASAYLWTHSAGDLLCMALAGGYLYCGGKGGVCALDARTGREVWRGKTRGRICSVAAAGGRIFAASDAGPVYCFGPRPKGRPVLLGRGAPGRGKVPVPAAAREEAGRILNLAGFRKGWCLLPESRGGALAAALAELSELQVLVLEKGERELRAARKFLEDAGIPAHRVAVEPWGMDELPPSFANLVVAEDASPSRRKALHRVLRPYGGVLLVRRPGGKGWDKFVRPALEGAGTWTQLYADPGNTACSGDRLLKGPFGLQWFGDPGPRGLVDRHARSTSPVVMDGRFFQEGGEMVQAYDAFNGTFLWRREIPGAVRVRADADGGNLALARDGLYLAAFEKCYWLDPATGRTRRIFTVPAGAARGPRRWGYISVHGKLLFGTAADPLRSQYASILKQRKGGAGGRDALQAFQRNGTLWRYMDDFPAGGSQATPRGAATSRVMAGDALFAMDRHSGRVAWIHKGKVIPNIAVCLGGGRVYLVEGKPSKKERAAAAAEKKALIRKGIYQAGAEARLVPQGEEDVRIACALDEKTGRVLWRRPLDLTGCGGDRMGAAYAEGVLLFYGNFSNHDTWLFLKRKLTWRRVTALDARTGRVLWSRPLNYLRRPLVVGRKIIIEPRACDLFTGRILQRIHPVSGRKVTWEFLRPGHCCAVTSASADTLFYRSFYAAIYELTGDKGLSLFGAIRPGCWINMIPACGLMVMPEASSGCTCSFPLRCSLALAPRHERRRGNWTVFICHGPTLPLEHLSVNFGAPGDLRDRDGTLWLAWPRPRAFSNIGYGYYAMKFSLKDKVSPGGGYERTDDRGMEMEGTRAPWLHASYCRGLQSLDIPLRAKGKGGPPGRYTVRIGFHSGGRGEGKARSFDVRIEGKVLLRAADLLGEAGGPGRAVVREFRHVRAGDTLHIDFLPEARVDFLQVLRERGGRGDSAGD